jgi:hypothetical protein
MAPRRAALVASVTIGLTLLGARTLVAQPPSASARGCCCVAQGKSYSCVEKTQADCLAEQPAIPTFPRSEDWKTAWSDWMMASETQEAKPLRGGWIAGPCEK